MYRLLSIDNIQYWDISCTLVAGALFIVAGTTPQPYHPRDLQAADYEKFEIKDGVVYRNVRFLSKEKKGRMCQICGFRKTLGNFSLTF